MDGTHPHRPHREDDRRGKRVTALYLIPDGYKVGEDENGYIVIEKATLQKPLPDAGGVSGTDAGSVQLLPAPLVALPAPQPRSDVDGLIIRREPQPLRKRDSGDQLIMPARALDPHQIAKLEIGKRAA
jgi:hypothetical protein